jgi:hypothetical protein
MVEKDRRDNGTARLPDCGKRHDEKKTMGQRDRVTKGQIKKKKGRGKMGRPDCRTSGRMDDVKTEGGRCELKEQCEITLSDDTRGHWVRTHGC